MVNDDLSKAVAYIIVAQVTMSSVSIKSAHIFKVRMVKCDRIIEIR